MKNKNKRTGAMSELISRQQNTVARSQVDGTVSPVKRRGFIETLDGDEAQKRAAVRQARLRAENRAAAKGSAEPHAVRTQPQAERVPQAEQVPQTERVPQAVQVPQAVHAAQVAPQMASNSNASRRTAPAAMRAKGVGSIIEKGGRRCLRKTADIIRIAVVAGILCCVLTGTIFAVLYSDTEAAMDAAVSGAAAELTPIMQADADVSASTLCEVGDRYKVTFNFYQKDSISCYSAQRTVGELVEMLGIELDETQVSRTDLGETVDSDMEIAVDDVSYGTDTVYVGIDYDVRYVDVQTIPKGSTRVYQQGVEGSKALEYKITYLNGVEVERELCGEYVSSYPTECIVYRGIGGTVSVGGQTYTYSYYLDCDSTVYTGGGITASGLPATEKVIAVDPSVIALGTTVYIEGIGFRTAADTGGSIKGNFIDIYYDSDNPSFAGYGRRGVRVYIF